jgi:hypothetical protein
MDCEGFVVGVLRFREGFIKLWLMGLWVCVGPPYGMGWIGEAVASRHTPIDRAPLARFAKLH